MLDVKKLLTKILLRFNNYTKVAETQTFTALNKSWKFRRIGNVVYVDASADASGSIPAGTLSIGTLPASMRPESNVYLKCTNNNADWRLYITPSGAVIFYHPTATSGAVNCGFSGYSFIAGGGYFITAFMSTLVRGWQYVRCEEIAGESAWRLVKYIPWSNKHTYRLWNCIKYYSNEKRLACGGGNIKLQHGCISCYKDSNRQQHYRRGSWHCWHWQFAFMRCASKSWNYIHDKQISLQRKFGNTLPLTLERGCIAC